MSTDGYIRDDGKWVIHLPVAYEVYGTVEVTVDSPEDLYEKLSTREYINMLPLPYEPEYVEDSYVVDEEMIEYIIEGILKQQKRSEYE